MGVDRSGHDVRRRLRTPDQGRGSNRHHRHRQLPILPLTLQTDQ